MRRAGVVLGLVGLVAAAIAPVGAQDPLVESARKEGRFTWYTSMNIDGSQPLLDAFNKKYPFIRGELWRVGSANLRLKRPAGGGAAEGPLAGAGVSPLPGGCTCWRTRRHSAPPAPVG